MKCPKCHYLSFEPEPRCRNCGYDLELADADLLLRTPEPEETPVRDLRLRDRAEDELPALVGATSPPPVRPMAESMAARAPRVPRPARSRGSAVAIAEAPRPEPMPDEPVAIPVIEAPPEPVPVPVSLDVAPAPPPPLVAVPPRPGRAPSTTSELPLFVKGILNDPARDPDEPLVAAPAVARPPLSVRRSAPEPARVETPASEVVVERHTPVITYVPDTRDAAAEFPSELTDAAQARAEARALVRAAHREAYGDAVGPLTRLASAAIDFALLAGIALGVLWLTLRLCELPFAQAAVLPLVPLGAFVLLVSLGYLWLFTATSGQTIGKMAMGLKVVGGADRSERLTMSQAASRVLWTAPSALALGLGFVFAFVGDGRTLHDRLSQTRVIRA